MSRIIIFTDKDGKKSQHTTMAALFRKSEYCELHRYRIQSAIAKTGKYERHGYKVKRVNK